MLNSCHATSVSPRVRGPSFSIILQCFVLWSPAISSRRFLVIRQFSFLSFFFLLVFDLSWKALVLVSNLNSYLIPISKYGSGKLKVFESSENWVRISQILLYPPKSLNFQSGENNMSKLKQYLDFPSVMSIWTMYFMSRHHLICG